MINAKRLLGYDKDENGELVINEEQAIIVRRIYKRYMERVPGYQIAKELNAEGVPTFARKEWSFNRILSIISNEKYAGDCLMQKHYMSSVGKQVPNRGQLAQYFVKNDHPGIVNRDDWNAAQQIRKERVRKTYAWSSLLRCRLCGATLIRVTSQWGCNWTCGAYMHRGKDFCIGIRVPEKYLIGFCFTEPMVVEEIQDEERTKSYRFTPAASFHR